MCGCEGAARGGTGGSRLQNGSGRGRCERALGEAAGYESECYPRLGKTLLLFVRLAGALEMEMVWAYSRCGTRCESGAVGRRV